MCEEPIKASGWLQSMSGMKGIGCSLPPSSSAISGGAALLHGGHKQNCVPKSASHLDEQTHLRVRAQGEGGNGRQKGLEIFLCVSSQILKDQKPGCRLELCDCCFNRNKPALDNTLNGTGRSWNSKPHHTRDRGGTGNIS